MKTKEEIYHNIMTTGSCQSPDMRSCIECPFTGRHGDCKPYVKFYSEGLVDSTKGAMKEFVRLMRKRIKKMEILKEILS